jgi:drug/metabolite transporter, DME family
MDRHGEDPPRPGAPGGIGHRSGLALVMLAAVLWATVGVASRLVPQDLRMSDDAYGFARTAVAGPVLLILARMTGGWSALGALRGDAAGLLVFGLSCALFQVGLFRSFSLLGVTITIFLTVCLPPVIAMIWAVLTRSESASGGVVAAMALAILGLAAFSGAATRAGSLPLILLGLGLSVGASVAFVVMSRSLRGLAGRHAPLMIAGVGLTVTAVLLAPVAMLMSPPGLAGIGAVLGDWRSGGVLVYLGLVPTALAYVCYCTGMARCRTAVAGLVASMIEPAVAAGLAYAILHDSLTLAEGAGCLLLALGMVTLWIDQAPQRRQPEPPEVGGSADGRDRVTGGAALAQPQGAPVPVPCDTGGPDRFGYPGVISTATAARHARQETAP